jgi:membrane-associated protein
LIQNYGFLTYGIIFFIIFIETGLVIVPFLPGDSLLFAAGAFAALGELNIALIITLLAIAAILGDTINYSIGKYLGPKVFKYENSFLLNKEYLLKTEKFYERHGKKTIALARFIPIIRTFAPFVAGIGKMKYLDFFKYNVIGGIVWVTLFSLAGYFFGNIPFIKENFSLVIAAIIILSFLPIAYEFFKPSL